MSQGSEPWSRPPGEDPVAPPAAGTAPSSAATPPRPGSGVIRPVPSQSQGPSFEAIAMQSVLSRARDSSRFSAPDTAGDAGGVSRGVPVGVVLLVALVVVALGVVAGALWVGLSRDRGIDDETIVRSTETAGTDLRTPAETVRGYLEALAAGNIAEALTFGPRGGAGSRVLLKDKAHASMPQGSRPSNITIGVVDPLATEIPVTYTLDGQDVATSIRVQRQPNGSYQLERSTVTIALQIVGGATLPVLVNGQRVEHQLPIEVVPGTYTLSTSLPFIAFPTDSATISILSLAHSGTSPFPVNPQLTQAGTTAFMEAARASLTRCIRMRELAPRGCPNGISARKPVVPGSVQWSHPQPSKVWQNFNPGLSAADQSVASATLALDLEATMDYTDGSSSGVNSVPVSAVVSAPMLGTDPAGVVVTWQR